MKTVSNKKVVQLFDTETAAVIGSRHCREYSPAAQAAALASGRECGEGDEWVECKETIYDARDGRYYLFGIVTRTSKSAQSCAGGCRRVGDSVVIPMTAADVRGWLADAGILNDPKVRDMVRGVLATRGRSLGPEAAAGPCQQLPTHRRGGRKNPQPGSRKPKETRNPKPGSDGYVMSRRNFLFEKGAWKDSTLAKLARRHLKLKT